MCPNSAEVHADGFWRREIPSSRRLVKYFLREVFRQIKADQHEIGWNDTNQVNEFLQRYDGHGSASIDDAGTGPVPASACFLGAAAISIERVGLTRNAPDRDLHVRTRRRS